MKLLVIGGGGREHALVWKLRQSPAVEKVWCAPGNGGIAQDAECVPVDPSNLNELVELGERLRPDLTVCGPELPLALGVADEFAKRGLRILGPTKQAAKLEGSKVFAKEFLRRHEIPTSNLYGIYDSPGDAYGALCAVDWPVVIKADGLCGGKGVLVTSSPNEATTFLERLMEKGEFGDSGRRVLLEEALEGQELSHIVLTDGQELIPMAPTRDHKRAFDGDLGPNTGGMGTYSTDELLHPDMEEIILKAIVRPTLTALANERCPYRGFLYFGLMLTTEGPKVLEFNCRMGDPEAQAIAVRMNFDLAAALSAAADGNLKGVAGSWHPGASVCVVLASKGYPGKAEGGKRIEGLESVQALREVAVFHAGTRKEGTSYYTSGGRVLGVCASGSSLSCARQVTYDSVSKIRFDGVQFRKDIGLGGLRVAEGA